MSLKINNWKKFIARTIWIILLLVVVIFFVRTAIWEHNYYESKEGSERSVSVNVAKNQSQTNVEPIIEEKPTETQIVEYTVPDGNPRYITIDALGVSRSRIVSLGETADGKMAAPNNIYDAGWYNYSARPGEGGVVVIDGHSGGPTESGIFRNLPSVKNGDIIKIEVGGSDRIYQYRIVEITSLLNEQAGEYMEQAFTPIEKGKESLTLISCNGEWSFNQNTYMSRIFVRAVLAE